MRLVPLGPLSDDGFDGYLDLKPTSALAATAVGVLEPDDIEEILGIGPVIGSHLRQQGITTFAQIAAWSPEDAVRIGDEIDFPGRVERERWIEQARDLHHTKYGN